MDETRNADGTFKKGVSGNPNGRIKGKKLIVTDQLLLDLQKKADDDDITNIQAIIKKLVSKAKAGDLRAIEIIIDRIEGKAKEIVELTQTVIEIDDIDEPDEDDAEDEPDNSKSEEDTSQEPIQGLQEEN